MFPDGLHVSVQTLVLENQYILEHHGSNKVFQNKNKIQEFLREQDVAKSPQARHVDPL